MHISPVFKDKTIGKLEAEWSDYFDPMDHDAEDVSDYQELMVETFPVLYKAWTDPSGMVSRDIAALLCSVRKAFCGCTDDDGNFIGNEVYDIADSFHNDLVYAFIFQNDSHSFELTGDGIIRIESVDCLWEVDSKTFELPDELPWKD